MFVGRGIGEPVAAAAVEKDRQAFGPAQLPVGQIGKTEGEVGKHVRLHPQRSSPGLQRGRSQAVELGLSQRAGRGLGTVPVAGPEHLRGRTLLRQKLRRLGIELLDDRRLRRQIRAGIGAFEDPRQFVADRIGRQQDPRLQRLYGKFLGTGQRNAGIGLIRGSRLRGHGA